LAGPGPDDPGSAAAKENHVKRDACALTFAMVFPAVMAWLYFVVFATDGRQVSQAVVWAFAAGKFLQFTFPLLYVGWFERAQLKPAAPTARCFPFGLALGLGIAAAILGIYFAWLRHRPPPFQPPSTGFRKPN